MSAPDEVAPDDATPDENGAPDENAAPPELPDLRYGGPIKGQATVRMALIAIGLVFFIGVAVGYLLGHGA